MKRGDAGSWNSGWKRSKRWKPILHNSKSPETPGKLVLGYIKNIRRRKHQRGATHHPRVWGARPTPWARPLPRGPPGGPPMPIFCYMESFVEEKNYKQAFGTRLHRHEAEPWRIQSRAPAELFCRGNFPPGGGNHHHRHHRHSSHRERAISINIFTSIISSPNPSSSLVSNSCL